MARPAAVAVGGYFPTPEHLLEPIARAIRPVQVPERKQNFSVAPSFLGMVDPCAGKGEAIAGLRDLLVPGLEQHDSRCHVYGAELEETRHAACKERFGWNTDVRHGDALHLSFTVGQESGRAMGASLLFLNPPYDEVRGERVEAKFLERFTPCLVHGGILVLVIPESVLPAVSAHVAAHYEDVLVQRFPEADYAAYKQVVVYGRRGEGRGSGTLQVSGEIGSVEGRYELPVLKSYSAPFDEWQMHDCDVAALLRAHQPWHRTVRTGKLAPVHGVMPEGAPEDLLLRRYPVAMPPRPAHIASAIASGLFNGSRVTARGRPALLVKGVFDRELRPVEEKRNKDGDVVGEVQVEQPKLVVTALDLSAKRYVTLPAGTEASGRDLGDGFNVADLLEHYGASLMGVMRQMCPVLYDPGRDQVALVESPRKLYAAQRHAAGAIVKILHTQRQTWGEPILLGELGSGKTTVALVAARSFGAKRMLVLCPPHLLDNWRVEVALVFPDAEVRVVRTAEDLDEPWPDGFTVAILSREAAKLGHGWGSVRGACPRCGSEIGDVDFAKKRERCEHRVLVAEDAIARWCVDVAGPMLSVSRTPMLWQVAHGRVAGVRAQREVKAYALERFAPMVRDLLARGIDGEMRELALLALGAPADLIEKFVVAEVAAHEGSYGVYGTVARLLWMLPPGSDVQRRCFEHAVGKETEFWRRDHERQFAEKVAALSKGEPHESWGEGKLRWVSGTLMRDDVAAGSLRALEQLFDRACREGRWAQGEVCGEPLYFALPEPRRVSVARHIVRYHPRLFDFLVLDEGHEYSSDGSAQERAGHRLSGLGLPTILMTGSIMNGYAESLFANWWALSPDFRKEFARDDRGKFTDRFGYKKILSQDLDGEGKVVAYGSHTDRVTRTEKKIGHAPGVLPLFIMRHLLPQAVTLHKSDLALDLPRCTQERVEIPPSKAQKDAMERLLHALVAQIRQDMDDEEKAGKLFGQLAELPSYFDRAALGDYEIRYPESVGGGLVASEPRLDVAALPKEDWMLACVAEEKRRHRKAMVLSWHVALLPRLAKLLEQDGHRVAVLFADKVAPGKRQAWIDREVVRKGVDVLVTNPVAVQTGLNNLVVFCTQVWMENPACNPITFRQAVGRIDRIGQTRETSVLFPVYSHKLPAALYDLLSKKVAVSVATDGLDPESALAAAGLGGDEYLTGLSIGRELWKLVANDFSRPQGRRPARGMIGGSQ